MTSVNEDDPGEHSNLVENDPPNPQPISLTQRLQIQIDKCRMYIRKIYDDTQKSKRRFRSMKKEMEMMKLQLNGIECYLQNIEKEKEASHNRGATTMTIPLLSSIDGVTVKNHRQPRMVMMKPDSQTDYPIASTSKSIM